MIVANVNIEIASEFTGKKAFKEAETAADKLNNSVKDLAKGLVSVYTAQKILSYAKASVKAFTEDDKAARTLTKTLNNLGLQFADPAVRTFISDLERQYNVLDDLLRPAYQKLVTGTGDWRKSQELLKTALDLSAQSGVDVVTVAEDLVNAYIGNTKGLRKYTLGLSAAQLAGMDFEAVLEKITAISKGQAASAADTYAGKMDKLTIVIGNLSEAIGESLVDSFANLAGNGDIDKSISKLEKFGQTSVGVFRLLTGADSLSEALNSHDYRFGIIPTERKPNTNRSQSPAGTAKRLAAEKKAEQEALRRAREAAKAAQAKAAAEKKALEAKRLGAAIDKANLALNKGTDVFDLDKIQVAAALTNQAQQLGKATSAAQQLQIINDIARLNVKKSILALEDAIASKDEEAIIKATAKLNEDLKILNALTGQKTQMAAIESILAGLKPKDLIDQKNLDEALRKIKQMMEELAKIKFPTPSSSGGGSTGGGSTGGGSTGGSTTILGTAAIESLTAAQAEAILATMPSSVKTNLTAAQISGNRYEAQAEAAFVKAVEKVGLATQTAQSSFLNGIQAGLNIPAAMSGARYAAQAQAAAGGQGYVINIQTGVGDPNAIAEAIDEVLRQARDRGTLTAV